MPLLPFATFSVASSLVRTLAATSDDKITLRMGTTYKEVWRRKSARSQVSDDFALDCLPHQPCASHSSLWSIISR